MHFLVEVAMFKTMSLKAAANPMAIAGKWLISTFFVCALECINCFLLKWKLVES